LTDPPLICHVLPCWIQEQFRQTTPLCATPPWLVSEAMKRNVSGCRSYFDRLPVLRAYMCGSIAGRNRKQSPQQSSASFVPPHDFLMVARCLLCPVVMEFQWDEFFREAQKWRFYLQLGFDQNGETTVSLTSRQISSPGPGWRYQKTQWSGWHGSWKTLASQDSRGSRHAISAKFHFSGNEARAYEHRIDKLSNQKFLMGLIWLRFTGLKTQYIYEKQLTDGEPTRFPLDSVLHPEEGKRPYFPRSTTFTGTNQCSVVAISFSRSTLTR